MKCRLQTNFLVFAFLFLTLFSCKKNVEAVENFSEAKYTVELIGQWTSPDFSVPPDAHYTNFAGMIHSEEAFLWQPGKLASRGVENVAETGNTNVILAEIDTLISNNKAFSVVYFAPPAPSGTKKISLNFNSRFSFVSFVSMIAPSPDWFVGVNSFNLYRNKQWVKDTTIQLYVYDSGTEDGDVFGYFNPSTSPQQPIFQLQSSTATVLANGNTSLKPLLTARFVRQ